MLHKVRGCCKPAKWALGQSHRNLAISSQCKSSDGLTLIELPVEKSNIGKISYKKTVYYLPLSKIKKGHINVVENHWGSTCSLSRNIPPPSPPLFTFLIIDSIEKKMIMIVRMKWKVGLVSNQFLTLTWTEKAKKLHT